MTNILFLSIMIIMFFFCLYFFLENQKLKEKIQELETENQKILETKIVKNHNKDQVPIQKISKESHSKTENSKPNFKEEKEVPKKKIEYVATMPRNIPKNIKESREVQSYPFSEKNHLYSTQKTVEKIKPYQKNTLESRMTVTSPVSISKEDTFDIDKLSIDLNEFIKKSERVVPKIKENIKNPDYLKEISDKMANELKPQTIELTDYEKEQEEHAIISYKELIAIRDKISILDDEDENINFIEELKHLRNNLNE